MTSKLFHTVVAFGITLGAMTTGCSAETTDASESSEAAQTTYGTDVAPVDAAPTPPVDATKDRFCEVPWPTTKGRPLPTHTDAKACIDPKNDCGEYPVGTWGEEECARGADVNSCDFTQTATWMICKTTAAGAHEWVCPANTVLETSCVWLQPDPTDTNTRSPRAKAK